MNNMPATRANIFYLIKNIIKYMPQLVPFYFLNLLTFGILTISILLYFVSTKLLPSILRLLIARILIIKL